MQRSGSENAPSSFPLARKGVADAPVCLDSGPKRRARFPGLRRRGERRHNFLRRWLWRGVDELRRQQANPDPPQIGGMLDLKS